MRQNQTYVYFRFGYFVYVVLPHSVYRFASKLWCLFLIHEVTGKFKDITFAFSHSHRPAQHTHTQIGWSIDARDTVIWSSPEMPRERAKCTVKAKCTALHCFSLWTIDPRPIHFALRLISFQRLVLWLIIINRLSIVAFVGHAPKSTKFHLNQSINGMQSAPMRNAISVECRTLCEHDSCPRQYSRDHRRCSTFARNYYCILFYFFGGETAESTLSVYCFPHSKINCIFFNPIQFVSVQSIQSTKCIRIFRFCASFWSTLTFLAVSDDIVGTFSALHWFRFRDMFRKLLLDFVFLSKFTRKSHAMLWFAIFFFCYFVILFGA